MREVADRRFNDAAVVKVRDACETDKAGLRTLWAATWRATYTPLIGPAGVDSSIEELDRCNFRNMLPGLGECCAVAILNEAIVGSAIITECGAKAYLSGMYVHPDHQRRGIGTALLRYVHDRLTTAALIEAAVVQSSSWAIAFYTRCGFVEIAQGGVELAPGRFEPVFVMDVSREVLLDRLERAMP